MARTAAPRSLGSPHESRLEVEGASAEDGRGETRERGWRGSEDKERSQGHCESGLITTWNVAEHRGPPRSQGSACEEGWDAAAEVPSQCQLRRSPPPALPCDR